MTIELELYQKIRRLYLVDKLSQREIARLLNVSRKTIKKYCNGNMTPDSRKVYVKKETPLRQAVEAEIVKMLEENKTVPHKQQLTAKSIWENLKKQKGFNIGESTVRNYVRELKAKNPEVFIPLEFEPGEAMEFDWGDAYAYLSGIKTKVSVFCNVLPYSYGIYASVYPDKSNLSFFMGHIKAFEFFNGVPLRCIYDNLKSAVLEGSGKEAVKQEAFKKLEAHYAFEGVFCNSAAGWEKGAVENLVAIIRKIAFMPMPKVNDFHELQEHVTQKCLEYCETHRLKDREKSIKEMLDEERKHLLPLPAVPLDPARVAPQALVHSDLTVRLDGVKYSAPASLAGQYVTLKVTPFQVLIYHQGVLVYTHQKAMHKQDHQYIPEHYLEILERKPRAIKNAVPLKKGVMPKELSEFTRLNHSGDKNEQLMQILILGRTIEHEKLLWAIKQANSTGSPTYDLVCFYLSISASKIAEVASPVSVEPVDLKQYDQLILGGEMVNETRGNE
jgi:transposase